MDWVWAAASIGGTSALVSTGRRAVYTEMFNRVKALQFGDHDIIAIFPQNAV